MITALLSSVMGLFSGAVPGLLKEWRDSREHAREMDMLRVQTEMQLKIAEKQGETRIAEMDREIEISAYETQGQIAVASLKNTGIKFVDGWNGSLRPFAVTIILILFAVIASFYSYAVLSQVKTPEDMMNAVDLLWNSLIGESVQAVLGFLFGYRSVKK